MSAAVQIDASQIKALKGFMAHIGSADTSVLMERIGIVGEDAVSENFEGEHDPDGLPWLPSLRAKKQGGKTLTDQGELVGSVESQATRDSAEIGTNKIYAAIHNFGGTIKRERSFAGIADIGFTEIKMPQRQFLGWGRFALEEAEAQAEDWLAGLLPAGALS